MALKRVAGVEPFYLPSGVPPAHDSLWHPIDDPHRESPPDIQGGGNAPAGASVVSPRVGRPPEPPSDAFARHFFRCFFCRIGDNRIEDHFCETGRDLLVAVLDECYERESS